MTKFDEMFAEYIKKQSKFDPDVFTVNLPNDSQVEIRGPRVPYSQEVDWEGVYPDPTNIRRNNNEHH